MPEFHVLYGLHIASDFALPGVPIVPSAPLAIDLRVGRGDRSLFSVLGSAGPDGLLYTSAARNEDGQPNLRVTRFRSGRHFDVSYSDGARFAVEREGREVWADWPDGYTLEDAVTYLVGPVMGFVLRLRGVVPLHASALVISGRAVALVGPPGAGKSTTAAAFAHRGFAVLSDDLVALRECEKQFLVQPGYPRLNLWPDAVRALFGSEDALPRITPTWRKQYLALERNGRRFETSPMPLAAIYVLGERDTNVQIPVIEEVSGVEAVTTLVANTYVNYLLDRDMRRREFDVLGRLIADVPVRRVRPSADPLAISGLCQAIANDAQKLIEAVPAAAMPQRT